MPIITNSDYTIAHRTSQWCLAVLTMRGHFLSFLCEYYKEVGWHHTAGTVYETEWYVRRKKDSRGRTVFGSYEDQFLAYDPVLTEDGHYGYVFGSVS
jgi:hypothetical protein